MSRKPTDTKERILDTATNLFSTHGYSATSVDDILTAVGITKGAFYHYFKSKEHLCETVLDHAIDTYQKLADSIQQETGSEGALQKWLEMLLDRQSSGKWLYCRLLTRLSVQTAELNASIQNQLRTFWLWMQSFYETLIQRGIKENRISESVDPAAAARLFISAYFGALWLDRSAPSPQDLTRVCETLLRAVSAKS